MEKLEMYLLRELLRRHFPKRTDEQITQMYTQLINEPGAEKAYVHKDFSSVVHIGVICSDGRRCYYLTPLFFYVKI